MADFHQRTKDAAKGQWRGILMTLGVPGDFLRDRHGPCPFCEGKDRFRWDNKDGSGSFICGQCGAGNGIDFAMRFLGTDFQGAARAIDDVLGNHSFKPDRVKPDLTEADRLAYLRKVAAKTVKLAPDTLGARYLFSRGLSLQAYPPALRFAAALSDGDGGLRPCMVATVKGPDGENVTLHRTYLRDDGRAKAEIENCRKLMPGSLPDGSAVQLSDYTGGVLGIAEGIETALAVTRLFEVPCWAALTAGMLEKWSPPAGCEEVAIYGDHDASFTGHAAAYSLARKLHAKGIIVSVHIPDLIGDDWNDVLLRGMSGRERVA